MSRTFRAWHEQNADIYPDVLPPPYDLKCAERDTAVGTLRDIVALTAEGLPDAEVRHRVAAIASATLEALGETAGDAAPTCRRSTGPGACDLGDPVKVNPPF
jgi:hypothetical protein